MPPGVVNDHAYAVLGYDAKADTLHIWNPWGNHFEPKGDMGLEHGYSTKGGHFDMPLKDFVRVYEDSTTRPAFRMRQEGTATRGGAAEDASNPWVETHGEIQTPLRGGSPVKEPASRSDALTLAWGFSTHRSFCRKPEAGGAIRIDAVRLAVAVPGFTGRS